MKVGKKILTSNFILILLLGIFFSSCYKNNTASIIIDLRSTGLAKVSEPKSFIDRIINFLMLSREANAATPSNITSYQLNISSPGMNTITADYPANISSIEMEVPAGNNKKISLTANIDSSDTRAVLAYTGTVTVNLDAGETKNVNLSMMTSETKIVIPDYFTNYRLVQIDNMNGTNWKTLTNSNITGISLSTYLTPYDVAFDARGRIYIVNFTTNPYTTLFRIDYIPPSGTVPATQIINGSQVQNIRWVAIDMKNSILYFATDTQLYKSDLDGNNRVSVLTPGATIYGISVDDDSFVYIVYSNFGTTNIVAKYNPANFTTPVATFNFNTHYGDSNYFPRDVVVKSNNVYVAVNGGILAARKIVLLNSNLEFVNDYGTGTNGTAPGQFYGPCHFVARLNRKIFLMDDGNIPGDPYPYFSNKDKLISMDDINGTNWTIYGSNGSGEGYFQFYYSC